MQVKENIGTRGLGGPGWARETEGHRSRGAPQSRGVGVGMATVGRRPDNRGRADARPSRVGMYPDAGAEPHLRFEAPFSTKRNTDRLLKTANSRDGQGERCAWSEGHAGE